MLETVSLEKITLKIKKVLQMSENWYIMESEILF
ncbi:hypothetical protein CUS12_08180 [Enterococcus faecalis]|nr:hypothetical protein CUS12_08180 [Enterococcus faecalis]